MERVGRRDGERVRDRDRERERVSVCRTGRQSGDNIFFTRPAPQGRPRRFSSHGKGAGLPHPKQRDRNRETETETETEKKTQTYRDITILYE